MTEMSGSRAVAKYAKTAQRSRTQSANTNLHTAEANRASEQPDGFGLLDGRQFSELGQDLIRHSSIDVDDGDRFS